MTGGTPALLFPGAPGEPSQHYGLLMMRIDAAQEAGDPSRLKTPEVMSLALSVSDEDNLERIIDSLGAKTCEGLCTVQ